MLFKHLSLSFRVAFADAHRSRFELKGTKGAAVPPSSLTQTCVPHLFMTTLSQVLGADSLNLSPDVYDSHKHTTVARAVEESKLYVVCSNRFKLALSHYLMLLDSFLSVIKASASL
jgi:hypothetical protein